MGIFIFFLIIIISIIYYFIFRPFLYKRLLKYFWSNLTDYDKYEMKKQTLFVKVFHLKNNMSLCYSIDSIVNIYFIVLKNENLKELFSITNDNFTFPGVPNSYGRISKREFIKILNINNIR